MCVFVRTKSLEFKDLVWVSHHPLSVVNLFFCRDVLPLFLRSLDALSTSFFFYFIFHSFISQKKYIYKYGLFNFLQLIYAGTIYVCLLITFVEDRAINETLSLSDTIFYIEFILSLISC